MSVTIEVNHACMVKRVGSTFVSRVYAKDSLNKMVGSSF